MLLSVLDITYITSKPKLAEPEVEVKLYSNYYNNTLYNINLYTEPGIEAIWPAPVNYSTSTSTSTCVTSWKCVFARRLSK